MYTAEHKNKIIKKRMKHKSKKLMNAAAWLGSRASLNQLETLQHLEI